MDISQPPVLSKRLKIVYLVISLAGLMAISLQLPADFAYWGVAALMLATYGVTVISLDLDLRREEWVVLPLYSLLTTIIYFSWTSPVIDSTTKALLAAAGYSLIMYGILLTLNILNVSTIRTIPLARPANTVLSLAGLAGSFGLFQLSLVSQPTIISWILAVGGSTVLIAWPLIWVSQTHKQRFQRSIIWTIVAALFLMQLAAIVSFWPTSFLTSLALAAMLYLILGVLHLQQKKLLNQEIKRQYVLLGGVAVVLFMLITQW